MPNSTLQSDRFDRIRSLFDEYIEMYASRDDRLTEHFSDDFSGYTGGGNFLVKDRDEWIRITRQDFAQVKGRIRIEMLDIALQDISDSVVVITAFFHIHLPVPDHVLAREVARLVLIFRLEEQEWKIVHSGISIPYHLVQEGEVYPLKQLQEKNNALENLVRERTQALEESQELYRLLTEDTQDVLWKTDSQLVVTYISPSDQRLRGYAADQVVGHHVFDMFTPEGIATVQKILHQDPTSKRSKNELGFSTFEVQHRCKDGRVLWGEVLSKPELNAQGTIVGFHGITREITERKRLQDQIHHLAFNDALTGLPNRRLLLDRLDQSLAASKRNASGGAVIFLDLDNFKPLNDTHGHDVGDLLLMEVARRLTACVRQVDTVARLGGDEFVVLLGELSVESTASAQEASIIAEKIRLSIAAPYILHVHRRKDIADGIVEHHCSASIGVAMFANGEISPNEILKRADAAMYQAKDLGRNTVRFFHPE
jgi:diguanylate cyclase (GGDEF)-like protein/PAS domain S-box-containing protein